MDEMNNMNETTMENETSVEVVPEEKVQVVESNSDSEDISTGKLLIGGVVLGAAALYGVYKHHKNKKGKTEEKKPKTKKKLHLRAPWVITEEVQDEKVEMEDVDETSDEEA